MLMQALGFGLITAAILSISAVGFTVQFGVTNILNLAYGDVMTAAAFVAYVATSMGWNPWLGLVVGGVFGAVFSFLLNRLVYTPFIRRGSKLFVMIIITIAVAIVIQNMLQVIWGPEFFTIQVNPGATVHVLGMVFTTTQLFVILIAALALVALHALLRFSRIGKAMRATASDPELARNCGIATKRVIDLAWLISGALCGVAGVALVIELGSFQSTTGGAFLVPIIAAAILGGVGQIYGAMLGGLIIGLTTELAAAYINPEYKDVIAFLVLIIVLLVRPQGILSEVAAQKEVAA